MARILDFADGFESSVAPDSVPVDATQVSVTPDGNLSSTDAQAAFEELQGDIDAINTSKGANNGIATLDAGGKVPSTQLPAIAITEVYVVADITERDALTVDEGDIAKVTDAGGGTTKTFIYDGSVWVEIQADGQLAAHESETSAHGVAGDIVGTSDAQILTNKDIDGGTASNSSRLTVPKNTKSNLDSLTRKEATIVYATDEAKAYIDNGSTLIPVGSGSGGGLNYIENGDAELSSPAPSLYADSGATPTDGQGGSVNTSTELNFSRSTSSPLRGSASWVFDKKSGNQQGKGGSFPFTIDSADQAKVMQIGFDYAVASGTYATGDVAIYIVDVTNSTVIQPSAYQVESVGVNSTARLTFQTASNSTSYRLCFHVASTSASAYSLKFDNITLGPQVVPMGAPVTDWVSFTPTVSGLGSAGSASGYPKGLWRRAGDSAHVRIQWLSNSSAGSGTAAVTFSIPSGMTIDTAKLATAANSDGYLGTGWVYGVNTASQADGVWAVRPETTTTLSLSRPLNATTNLRGGDIAARPVAVNIDFILPIVGWSSSTVVSSSANTRVVAGSNGKASAQAITATTYGTAQKITYNTTPNLDTHGMWDSSNNRWVVKVPGKYRISAPLAYQATTSEVQGIAMLRQNTSDIHQVYLAKSASTSSLAATATLEAIVDCKAGDYFEVFTYRPIPAGSLDILANTAVSQVRFMIEMLQGPSQIAMSEIVAMQANTCSTTITGLTALVFSAKNFDTHNGYNTSTGIYTVPAPGLYEVDFTVHTNSASWTAGQVVICYVYKNGSPVGDFRDVRPATASVQTKQSGTMLISCVAGDTLAIRSDASITYTADGSAIRNFFAVKRLGGM